MGAKGYHITSVFIVYSTVCLGVYQEKTPKLHGTGLCEGNPLVIYNVENASI